MDRVILERDGQAQTVAAYTHEGGSLYHDLISMHRSDSYYHLFDGLGSVSEVTDGDEAVQNRYRYEAFGQFKLADETVPNPYTYVGAFGVQWDAGTGLHFMQARYYASTIGRFISMDPLRGAAEDPLSLHRYVYALNNPGRRVDPSGLMSRDQRSNLARVIECFAKCGYWFEYYAAQRFQVKSVRWMPGAVGWTNPVTGTVYIEEWVFDDAATLFATLAHEMQHIYDWFVCLRPFRTHQRPWRNEQQMHDDFYAHCWP